MADANHEEVTDARFDDSRPQFQSIRSEDSKVVLDERFASALTDPRFQLPGDGTKKHKTKKSRERLSEFYTIQQQKDAKGNVESDPLPIKTSEAKHDGNASKGKQVNTQKTASKKNATKEPESRISHLMALARGEVDVSSSSDDDDDDSQDDDSSSGDEPLSDEEDEEVGVLDTADAEELPMTDVPSPYLAIMNLDWTNVRAVDIFAIVSSFVPPGALTRVRVFPSDFGLKKMAKEQLTGPTSIWKRKRRKDTDRDHSESKSVVAEDESSVEEEEDINNADISEGGEFVESDFNPEKLRAYEVSKLKYYFGIVEFSDPKYADIAYKQVDGMEFEHSSAAVDMRSIEVDQIDDVVKNRPMRDESTGAPSNYEPPDFVVNALQQSNVDCTWDVGDQDRERVLTKYISGESWKELAEEGQLNQYLASDVSSAESSDEEGEKAQNMRKLLGLEGNDDGDGSGNETDEDDDNGGDEQIGPSASAGNKAFKFVPTATKKDSDDDCEVTNEIREISELSPWEKYKEKRKQKKREKRQAAREKRQQVGDKRKGTSSADDVDSFFDKSSDGTSNHVDAFTQSLAKSDLELLATEDDIGESGKDDYDMRALQRAEKIKNKKLKGKRKQKEEKAIEAAVGDTFHVDTKDDRFRAVLDGTDSRFGIDRTDPNFKETTGMQTILSEQTRRRKQQKRRIPEINDPEGSVRSSESRELQSLVQKLKKKTKH